MSAPEIHLFQHDRFAMEYCSFGTGERPLVIIPGISMKPVMLSAAALAPAFSEFTSDWTVYVFDRKKDIRPGYSVWDMAEDTAAVMAALGLSGCDIFGASQGGMIAQCIAVAHPELVHGLYLAATMARPHPMCRSVMDTWIGLSRAGDIPALNRGINTRVYSPAYYDAYRAVFAEMEKDGTAEEAARFLVLAQACLDFDIYDRLGEIRCPVFVAGAREDRVLSGEASEELAQRLHCSLTMYEGYGHAVYDEAPDFRPRMKEALLSIR